MALFSDSQDSENPDLPVITGLETKIFGPKPGRRYNNKELSLALSIIREAKANRVLRKYKIRKIDLANPENISVLITLPIFNQPASGGNILQQNLEIKLAPGTIKDKIAFLGGLFVQSQSELSNIKYIDLRFKDPVIKLKDKQKSAPTHR